MTHRAFTSNPFLATSDAWTETVSVADSAHFLWLLYRGITAQHHEPEVLDSSDPPQERSILYGPLSQSLPPHNQSPRVETGSSAIWSAIDPHRRRKLRQQLLPTRKAHSKVGTHGLDLSGDAHLALRGHSGRHIHDHPRSRRIIRQKHNRHASGMIQAHLRGMLSRRRVRRIIELGAHRRTWLVTATA